MQQAPLGFAAFSVTFARPTTQRKFEPLSSRLVYFWMYILLRMAPHVTLRVRWMALSA